MKRLLEAAGFRVFMDIALENGQNWGVEINENVNNADAMVMPSSDALALLFFSW